MYTVQVEDYRGSTVDPELIFFCSHVVKDKVKSSFWEVHTRTPRSPIISLTEMCFQPKLQPSLGFKEVQTDDLCEKTCSFAQRATNFSDMYESESRVMKYEDTASVLCTVYMYFLFLAY